jgi:hemerythrin superfamily protein
MADQSNQMEMDLRGAILQDHEQVKRLFEECVQGGTAAQDAWDALIRLLAVHETAEEEVLHPTVKGLDDEARAAVEARLQEEDKAKKELSELEAMDIGSPEFAERLKMFRDDVLAHAEQEEQTVLPLLDRVDAEELDRLGSAFVAAKAVAPTHPHPHGPESAVGNIVLGPAVALMDRARDAIKAVMDRG